jgi:hypothetical protein
LALPRSARGPQGEIRSEICSAGQIRFGGQIRIAGEIPIGGQIRLGRHDIHPRGLPGVAMGVSRSDHLSGIGAEIRGLISAAIRRVPTRSLPRGSARTLGLAGVPDLLRDTG